MIIHIGTSGYAYRHWATLFYPEHCIDLFSFYTSKFNSLEINNTHYVFPKATTIEKWHNSSPENFLFSIKAHQSITHWRKLNSASPTIDFIYLVAGLKKKLGPILFQLPPRWKVNVARLEQFILALPPGFKYVFEFRNDTWRCDPIINLLIDHKVSWCIYDYNFFMSPDIITSNLIYLRLHGPGRPYEEKYSDEFQTNLADKIRRWSEDGYEAYVYYDNDNFAYAPINALDLQNRLLIVRN